MTESQSLRGTQSRPVVHRNVRYNCRVLVLDGRIVLIRPKMVLADSGNYHESRYFARWPRFARRLDEFFLPRIVRQATGQGTAPFGEAVIATLDTCIGFEVCEEFFVSNAPHTTMALSGIEIISNGSASHFELGKLDRKRELIQSAMGRSGGIYLYANCVGCDGDRVYYDGGSLIAQNGAVVAVGGAFSLEDVALITAVVDLESVRTFRGLMQSMAGQAEYAANDYLRIVLDGFALSQPDGQQLTVPRPLGSSCQDDHNVASRRDELIVAPALWLFDYLRQSGGASGFLLPLSGGLDSGSVALVVFRLAELLAEGCRSGVRPVSDFVRDRLLITSASPEPRAICGRLLTTIYLGTEHSSEASRQRAAALALALGTHHMDLAFDAVVGAVGTTLAGPLDGFQPRFAIHGGQSGEDRALQNIQARLRMVLSYAIAQLAPIALEGRPLGGLLVLATANASECLAGYYTKYDASSGDVNPIGSYDKLELRQLVTLMAEERPTLRAALTAILEATPSAELTPTVPGVIPQTDETDMGLTYAQLAQFGLWRCRDRAGPHSLLAHLRESAPPGDSAAASVLVQRFLQRYAANRHKATSLPPTLHATPGSPDDNRHDLRPILYPRSWATSLGYRPLSGQP